MQMPKKISVLDPLVAQRIAAGEVIERPASVVRELLDNAIDANATSIEVELIQGGIERITVIDNGFGIAKEQLPLCCKSHATSKVSTLEDLQKLATMGFRGEALYAIAASAKITIASTQEGELGHTIVVDNGTEEPVFIGGPAQGTKVDVEHLFSQIPARRLFLKRPSTEFTMCRNVFIEKAIAFPNISFRLYDEKNLRLDLPATDSKTRLLNALVNDKNIIASEMVEFSSSGKDFSLYAIASTSGVYRSDRSHIKIFINKRGVDEYALVQAVTYGYGEILPGGAFPYCYLFVDIDPDLVDFNIHPAKKEVKLRNKAEIHHQVVTMIRQQLQKKIPQVEIINQIPLAGFDQSKPTTSHQKSTSEEKRHFQVVSEKPTDSSWFDKAKEVLAHHKTTESSPLERDKEEFRYIGQIFNLFLIVEKEDSIYLIDQHAAHERLVYDQIKEDRTIQRLMIPLKIEVERSVDDYLLAHGPWYAEYGIELKKIDDLEWELTTLPASWRSIESEIVEFISSHATGDIAELQKRLYATVACHAAIRSGDTVDRTTAEELIKKVFQLEHPVCPHGRIFVIEITKEHLYKSVGRII
jgi:DNA mismatch repair protein MutL